MAPDEVLDHRFKVKPLISYREKVAFGQGGGIGEIIQVDESIAK